MIYSPEQLRAVAGVLEHLDTNTEAQIIAPAGSGKTAVVVELAKRTGAQVVTFTRRAGQELIRRGVANAGTIYAAAAECVDDDLLSRTVTEEVKEIVTDRMAARYGMATKDARRLREKDNGALYTVTDWLPSMVLADTVIVDEAQDCTAPEIRAIRRAAKRIVWVGDPWQRIYQWREPKNDPAEPLTCPAWTLTANFRSAAPVVARAAEISGRPEVQGQDSAPRDDGRVAWLCRSNLDAQALAKATKWHLVSGYNRRLLAEIAIEACAELYAPWALAWKAWPSWIHAADHGRYWGLPWDCVCTARTFLRWLHTHDLQDDLSRDEGPQIMTIHAAKGLQFGKVRVVGWPAQDREGEDRRLHYTAVTRGIVESLEFSGIEAALEAAKGGEA